MPSKRIILNGEVVNDSWVILAQGDATQDRAIIHFQDYLDLSAPKDNTGVWLTNDIELDSIAQDLLSAPVIAIEFPVFTDGRGFSLARLLRERYHYTGQIRAMGHIIRDQLCYLKRCGFTAFDFNNDIDLQAALASLNDFTEAYQSSVDVPKPLYRRRA